MSSILWRYKIDAVAILCTGVLALCLTSCNAFQIFYPAATAQVKIYGVPGIMIFHDPGLQSSLAGELARQLSLDKGGINITEIVDTTKPVRRLALARSLVKGESSTLRFVLTDLSADELSLESAIEPSQRLAERVNATVSSATFLQDLAKKVEAGACFGWRDRSLCAVLVGVSLRSLRNSSSLPRSRPQESPRSSSVATVRSRSNAGPFPLNLVGFSGERKTTVAEAIAAVAAVEGVAVSSVQEQGAFEADLVETNAAWRLTRQRRWRQQQRRRRRWRRWRQGVRPSQDLDHLRHRGCLCPHLGSNAFLFLQRLQARCRGRRRSRNPGRMETVRSAATHAHRVHSLRRGAAALAGARRGRPGGRWGKWRIAARSATTATAPTPARAVGEFRGATPSASSPA